MPIFIFKRKQENENIFYFCFNINISAVIRPLFSVVSHRCSLNITDDHLNKEITLSIIFIQNPLNLFNLKGKNTEYLSKIRKKSQYLK